MSDYSSRAEGAIRWPHVDTDEMRNALGSGDLGLTFLPGSFEALCLENVDITGPRIFRHMAEALDSIPAGRRSNRNHPPQADDPAANNERIAELEAEVAQLRTQLAASRATASAPPAPPGMTSVAPEVGDHVFAFHAPTKSFYAATIDRPFDRETGCFRVAWDDGDSTGVFVPYDRLALDTVPPENTIGVGSSVIFPQGRYKATEGSNDGGIRMHVGVITERRVTRDGQLLFSGRHSEGPKPFRSYEENFTDIALKELRMSPNVMDILSNNAPSSGAGGDSSAISSSRDLTWDVYLSYSVTNSAFVQKQISSDPEAPPSYGELVKQASDPWTIYGMLTSMGYKVYFDKEQQTHAPGHVIKAHEGLVRSRVFVACLSNAYSGDEALRQEMQFAEGHLRMPVVGLVVEAYQHYPWDWQRSWLGLLMAGELYIDFTNIENEQSKLNELGATIAKRLGKSSGPTAAIAAMEDAAEVRVFVSYCWRNSLSAVTAGQVSRDMLAGEKGSDPRVFATQLKASGVRVWLDIEQLEAGGEAGMFEQIADGLIGADLVVAFISDEYAASDNCQMECQFATKTLQKNVIPVACGSGSQAWKASVIGMLFGAGKDAIDLSPTVAADGGMDRLVARVKARCSELADSRDPPSEQSRRQAEVNRTSGDESRSQEASSTLSAAEIATLGGFRAPSRGTKVLAFHITNAYYKATVVSFDKATMAYTVDWEDGDATGRSVPYDALAMDVAPDPEDLGVGSIVIFPQGEYRAKEGANDGGKFYFKGVVTAIRKGSGDTVVDGRHEVDPEAVGRRRRKAYSYEWSLPLSDLRITSNAFDVLLYDRT